MEGSWENWHLRMEMDHGNDFLDKCHTYDDEEFLRDILLQPPFSSESESDQYHHHSFHSTTNSYSTLQYNNNNNPTSTVGSDVPVLDQSNSLVSQQNASNNDNKRRPRRSSSPRTYILSFDNSTMTPSSPEPEPGPKNHDQLLKGSKGITRSSSNHSPKLPSKRAMAEPGVMRDSAGNNQEAKKARNSSQSRDHIMAERKRRQELTERFIALSATIPGLSKTDKASILRAAIDYMKQLQERVQELEKQDRSKRSVESVILVRKSDANEDTITTSSETSSDHHHHHYECGTLPEIEARVKGKEVLIEIHCEKGNGIELKILDMLENLHLCVTGSSVLPFGNSALGITIIAQMGDAYKMTANDLVKNLKEVLLK